MKLLKSDLCSCVTELWFYQKSTEIKDSRKNVEKWHKQSGWCKPEDVDSKVNTNVLFF